MNDWLRCDQFDFHWYFCRIKYSKHPEIHGTDGHKWHNWAGCIQKLIKNYAKPATHPTNEMHILHLQMTTYHPGKIPAQNVFRWRRKPQDHSITVPLYLNPPAHWKNHTTLRCILSWDSTVRFIRSVYFIVAVILWALLSQFQRSSHECWYIIHDDTQGLSV